MVGELLFTFEELNTFIIEVENILNSRPISFLSADPNDPLALTPTHCLISRLIYQSLMSRLSQQIISLSGSTSTQVREDFWIHWSLEYLNELQVRHK